MGVILSKHEEIERVHFRPLKKGQVYEALRVMRLDDGTAIVHLKQGGYSIVGRRDSLNGAVAMAGVVLDDHWSGAILRGLVRMGIVSKETAEAHSREMRARSKRSEIRSSLRALKRSCDELGIPLPAKARSIALREGIDSV